MLLTDFFAEVYIERIELIVVCNIAKLILFQYYSSLSDKFMYVLTISTILNDVPSYTNLLAINFRQTASHLQC